MLPFHKTILRLIVLLGIPLLVAKPIMAAASIDELPSVTVQYHDLNLNSREGITDLYERIHAAAVDVCNSALGPLNRDSTERDVCISQTVANAVHPVHNEKLSAYHWERIRGWRSHRAAAEMSAARH